MTWNEKFRVMVLFLLLGTHVCTVTNALIFHKNLTIFKCLNFQKFYAKTFDINMNLCYSWNRS